MNDGRRIRRRLSLIPAACLLASIVAPSHAGNTGPSAKPDVAPIRSSAPSQITIDLPSGESLSLSGNVALAVYRDGPRDSVDLHRITPFAQRRLGKMRSTSFRVDEATRIRIACLVLHEIDHPPPLRVPRPGGPSPLRVTTYYTESQTGGKGRLDSAERILPAQETTSALVLRDLVQRLLEAHRSDDSL